MSNNFNFRDGQVILTKDPEILFRSKAQLYPKDNIVAINHLIYENTEKRLIPTKNYLFRANGDVGLKFHVNRESSKYNGVEMNQNAPDFSLDSWSKLMVSLPPNHELKKGPYGLKGPPGTYVYHQTEMTAFIRANNPVLAGEFLDIQENNHRFFIDYQTPEDIIQFNKTISSLVRDLKISSLLK